VRNKIVIWLHALRPSQWTKNAVVLVAWFFAVGDPSQAAAARGLVPALLALGMVASFCLVSSSFYLLNDVSDYEADRVHPVKKFRPVAADLISKIDAVRGALVLFALGLAFPSAIIALYPSRTLAFGTILAYTVLQCLYSGFLKRIPYVDVLVIALGFVLRAVAGAAVIAARISPWLLVCTFVLSFFLALCKRRHEKVLVETAAAGSGSRAALAGYRLRVLDVLIAAAALATVGVYLAYTLAPDTVARFGTRGLAFTSTFVTLGLARYLVLVYRRGVGGRPERVLLTDRILWLILAGYGLSAAGILVPRLLGLCH